MSSDEEEIKCSKGKRYVVDSDSDDNTEIVQDSEEKPDPTKEQAEKSDKDESIFIPKKKFVRVKRTVDSDADSGNEDEVLKSPTNSTASPVLKKFNIFADSDLYDAEKSDEETPNSKPSSPSISVKKSNIFGDTDLYDAEGSDDDNRPSTHSMAKKFGDKDLYDAEGSSDEETRRYSSPPKSSENTKKQPKKSAKAVKTEIEEIHRESQRIVRESNVSLPYHRPKQRTLAEFLQRRKSTPVMSLRTSKDKLNQVWKLLEEREKEAVEFYKSDSEHSDEEQTSAGNKKTCLQQDNSQSVEKTNYSEIRTKGIDSCNAEESNLVEDVTLVLESVLCKIVELETTSVMDTGDACVEVMSVITSESSQIFSQKVEVGPNEIEKLNKVYSKIENKSEVQNNTTLNDIKISESQSFELHLSESERFSEEIFKINENNVHNKLTKNELGANHTLVSASQDFELHLTESERFSEDINNVDVDKENCTVTNKTVENNPANEVKEDCVNVEQTKSVEEPSWMKAALKYEENIKQSTSLLEDKTSVKLNVPKITGGPSEIINLDGRSSTGMVDLMQRFIKHITLPKHKHKPSKQISIVSAERDGSGQVSEIKQEVVSVLVTEDEEKDPALAKPGAKFAKLKAQLQAQIGQRREHEWTKKIKDQRLYEEEIFDDEKSECDALDENVDESSDSDKEEEKDETEEEEDEEDDEEDEEYYVEKKKKPVNQFVDEEAEESEDDDGNEGEDEGEDSVSSFIKRPKYKRIKLKRMESADVFASQEIFNNNQFDEDEDEPLTIGQDSKDRDIEELSESGPEHNNILTQSPAFPLPALEGKDFENHFSWGSSPTLTQKEKFSIFKKEEQREETRSGLDDILSSQALPPSTQELMGLCSGQFTSQLIRCSLLENSQEAGAEDNASQDLDRVWLDDSQSQCLTLKTQSRKVVAKEEPKPDSQLTLILSDDEDILEVKTKTINKRKLNFSDDEEDIENYKKENDNKSEDEELDNENNYEAESVEGDLERNADGVEYDSEENEITHNAGDFLDKEAELSESDWSSEDEDEKGLDLLEQEEADKEKIDHDADKEELGKMHMRRMLVEDTKKVKLLQEMYLEDGDLHSDENGRQRLFRWSNQDGDEEVRKSLVGDSDDEKAEEEDDEENWRRSRHERETFLREHSKKMNILEVEEDVLDDGSQLFKLGKAALRKIQSNSQEPKLTPPTDPLTSPDSKRTFLKQTKRGSFLSRGQQVLSRLAELTAAVNPDAVLKTKNSRNFVFASISPTKNEPKESQPMAGKRKKPTLPLPAAKRPFVEKKLFSKKNGLLEQLAKCES